MLYSVFMLALRYWALPNIERFRPDIVAAISKGIGLKVTVGSIDARQLGLVRIGSDDPTLINDDRFAEAVLAVLDDWVRSGVVPPGHLG